ncbi:hypothetical protein HD553DRAFT_346365 [Filobasidium floriforme]|uniref:uncharacterized protein n=1 Tax=Filobasidium floriforme TaxID=5210 RepID=UPI001E8DE4A1|nr:uncharacterized protein HD553DRAFT_346365 [Filobasidium floriforme]KAH8077991.1 hypothetical protein HD553DRAFT_346365 [Filobasidium floriforme]
MSEYHHHHHPHQQQQQQQQQHVQRDWSQHEREYYASLSDLRTFQQPLPHPNHHHGQYPYPSPIGEGPRGYLAGPAGTLVAPSTQGHPQTAEFGGTRDMSPLDSPLLTSINALPSLPAAPAIPPAQAATPTSAPGNPPANQNVCWYEWMEDLLADLLVAEVKVTRNKVTMGMPVFSKIANLINEAMDARTDPTPNGRLDGIKVKNKTGILTAEFYKPLERMRKRSGWGWDHQLHRPLVDDEAFEDYVKHWIGTPTVSQIRCLRDNGWRLYPKWKIIREGHGATGDFAFRGGAPIPSQPEPPAGATTVHLNELFEVIKVRSTPIAPQPPVPDQPPAAPLRRERRFHIMPNATNINIPPFGGEDFASWLKSFQTAMLMMDYEDNAAKQAKFFAISLVDGSVAAQWYQGLDDNTKADWNLILAALRIKFGQSADDRHAAFRELVSLKLPDEDVGKTNSEEVQKQGVWARKVAVLATRAGPDEFNNNAFLVFNNVGPQLQSILVSGGATETVKAITTKVETMSPAEIETLQRTVKKEQDATEWAKRLAAIEGQMRESNQRPLAQQPSWNSSANATSKESEKSNWRSRQDRENAPPIELGPFPSTQSGVEAYKRAVSAFYSKHGMNSTSSLSKPFPLSPGTVPAGNNECFNCGKTDHLRTNCRAPAALPLNEQRYRGLVMQQRRAEAQQGLGTGSNLQQPLRALGYQSPYMFNEHDYLFSHLQHLPITPDHSPMSLPSELYGSENGQDSDQ